MKRNIGLALLMLGLQFGGGAALAQDPTSAQAPPAVPAVEPPPTPNAENAAPVDPADPMLGRAGEAWFAREWEAYKARFLLREGRIVDNANGLVSHSEGQGYGMLLAVLAGDAPTFETIWRWTQNNLIVGPDGLAAWKWDPQRAKVADTNNASDGDILIAWALAKASRRFERPDYLAAAQTIAQSIGATLIKQSPSGPILMPGKTGFGSSAQPDGPIINLSYYIFPAFEDLKALAPDQDWDGLRDTGLKMIGGGHFGPQGLPVDWAAFGKSKLRPARNFSKTFGYDAIRIPLYVAWGANPSKQEMAPFASLWNDRTEAIEIGTSGPAAAKPPAFVDGGYRMILALASCVATGQVIPRDLVQIRDDLYYPATLRLLVVAAAQERYPQCL
jgi:endoglucanase